MKESSRKSKPASSIGHVLSAEESNHDQADDRRLSDLKYGYTLICTTSVTLLTIRRQPKNLPTPIDGRKLV